MHSPPSTNTQLTTIKKPKSLRMKTSDPDAKWPARIPRAQQALLPDDNSKYIFREILLPYLW